MQTTDKILSILNSMTVGTDPTLKTVLYESSFGANIRLDRNPDPAAILYLIESWTLDTSTNLKHKSVEVEVFFCKRFDIASKGEVVKQVMDSIEPIIDEFLSMLLSDKSIIVSEIKASSAYGRFDATVCGYSLQFSVTDKQGICL